MKNGDSVGVQITHNGGEAFIPGTFVGAFGELLTQVELPGSEQPERLLFENSKVRLWDEIPEAQRLPGWRLA